MAIDTGELGISPNSRVMPKFLQNYMFSFSLCSFRAEYGALRAHNFMGMRERILKINYIKSIW